jgi:hypothetical protein
MCRFSARRGKTLVSCESEWVGLLVGWLLIGEFVELVLELQTINFYQSFPLGIYVLFSILDDKGIIAG